MLVRWWGAGSSGSSGMVWGSCHADQVVGCGVEGIKWYGVGVMSCWSGGGVQGLVDQVVWCGGPAFQVVC